MRTPLIVISPKSLLRNPNATSSINELTDGSFQCVIDSDTKKKSNVKKIICSGKVFMIFKVKKYKIKRTYCYSENRTAIPISI